MNHQLTFCQDYDPDGYMVVCPDSLFETHILSVADPRYCPHCGKALPPAGVIKERGD